MDRRSALDFNIDVVSRILFDWTHWTNNAESGLAIPFVEFTESAPDSIWEYQPRRTDFHGNVVSLEWYRLWSQVGRRRTTTSTIDISRGRELS